MSFDNKLVQFYNQSLYPRRPVLALSYWSCGFSTRVKRSKFRQISDYHPAMQTNY